MKEGQRNLVLRRLWRCCQGSIFKRLRIFYHLYADYNDSVKKGKHDTWGRERG